MSLRWHALRYSLAGLRSAYRHEAAFCQELVVLKDGRLSTHGPVEDVLTPQLLREVFAVEGQVVRLDGFSTPRVLYQREAAL